MQIGGEHFTSIQISRLWLISTTFELATSYMRSRSGRRSYLDEVIRLAVEDLLILSLLIISYAADSMSAREHVNVRAINSPSNIPHRLFDVIDVTRCIDYTL